MIREVKTQNYSKLAKVIDFLVIVLIFFPLFLGGFWIRKPGLKVELVELGAPTLIVSFVIFLAWLKNQFSITELKTFQFLKTISTKWANFIKGRRGLLFGFVTVAVLWATAALRRHWSFGSGAADLGIFTSAIYNLSFGHGYISSFKEGINLFADHQSPIFWLFVPLFKIFPSPETLLVVQSIALASGGIAVYKIGTQYLSKNHIILPFLPLFYWIYLPVRNANSFDFHPEVLLLPAFLFSIYFLQSKQNLKRFIGLIFFILGIMGKESAPPVAIGICAAWLLGAAPAESKKFTHLFSFIFIPLAFAVFIFETKYVPGFFGKTYAYSDHYQKYGEGILGILTAPFLKPDVFWPKLFSITRLKFLFWTLAPLAFIPLLGFRAFVAAIPGYLMLFLSEGDHRVNPIYHYAAEPAVGVFWAFCVACSKIDFSRYRVQAFVLFFCFATFGRSEIFKIRYHSPNIHHRWLKKEFLPCVDSTVSVSASGALSPHLAARHWAHHLPKLDVNSLTLKNETHVNCVIIDPLVNNWPLSTDQEAPFKQELKNRNYKMIYQCEDVAVYSHDESSCMRCTPNCSNTK